MGSTGLEDDVDVSKLSDDKIRELMRRDPRFIGRLINMLDSQFERMIQEKKRRKEQLEADSQAMAKLDEQIATHIQPHLTRLNEELKSKNELRDHLQKQLDIEMGNFKKLERDAAKMISEARHAAGKLYRTTATNTLLETKGFTSSIPTTTLLRGSMKKGSTAKGGASDALPAMASKKPAA